MRRVEDKRKTARVDAKTRKEEEKLRRKEEINKLKAIKREEILEKIKKAEFVAGKKLLEKAEKELGTEFIPDLYDKHMEQMFNDQYYNDIQEDGEEITQQKDIDLNLMNDKAEMKNIGIDAENPEDSDEEVDEENILEHQKNKQQIKFEKETVASMKKQVEDNEK